MSRTRFIAGITGTPHTITAWTLYDACRAYGVSMRDVTAPAKGKTSHVTRARWLWFDLLARRGMSKAKIARVTGFDWTTIQYGINRHKERTQ